jgi:hypothetical protein
VKHALLALLAFALLCSAPAAGSNPRPLTAPSSLHAFTLRSDEPVRHNYAQLPAFAWARVPGANRYEVQLATSVTFTDSTMLADKRDVPTPVTSLQLQLPWMTGAPYALWLRVRAISNGGVSVWSKPFGFNTSWPDLPKQVQDAPEGLVRWTPVDGATAYDVWFTDLNIHVWTMTNVADEREYWAASFPGVPSTINWRVRAVRFVWDPQTLPDKIVKISYGPYSQPFSTTNKPRPTGPSVRGEAVSTATSTPGRAEPHSLTPGYGWTGNPRIVGQNSVGWRVYVFSDRQCVNLVTVGSLVQSPAWAPRWPNPGWVAPTTAASLVGDDAVTMFDQTQNLPTAEFAGSAAVAAAATASSTSPSSSASNGGSSAAQAAAVPGSLLALPDLGWPSGRFWWTVVPVGQAPTPDGKGTQLQDLELPQDACANGRVWSFGMQSMAATTEGSTPLASGFTGTRVTSSALRVPSFVELPVIAWKPVLGAQSYEIQLSHRLYPWHTVIRQSSLVSSVTLRLTTANAGRWYYRVRGIDQFLPGQAVKMTWSKPVSIRISGDQFAVK